MGDPQTPQNARIARCELGRQTGAAPVQRNLSWRTAKKLVKGDDVARRQLSQWQCTCQLGAPS
jgi:hypothetical protein